MKDKNKLTKALIIFYLILFIIITSLFPIYVLAFALFVSFFFFPFSLFIDNKYLKKDKISESMIIDYIKEFERKNNRQLIVAIDFDDTLCHGDYPNIGAPKEEMIELVKLLQTNNVYTILWTCRSFEFLEAAKKWCADHGLCFDKYNEHSDIMTLIYDCGTPKVYADFVIDDKGFNALNHIVNKHDFRRCLKEVL